MTTTTLNASSRVQKWDSQYFAEYIRNSGLMPYMGKGTNSIFQVKYELTGGGKTINIPLVTRLTGAGVTGSTALVGAEEELDNYSMSVAIDWLRNGVEIKKPEEHWTEMDLRAAARDMLQGWSMSKLRDDLIAAMYSIQGVVYGTATAAQRDAWLDDNIDRVLFGATKSNVSTSAPAGGATYDHSASLLNIDATNDKLTPAAISLMKRIAKTADPHIRPYKTNDGSGREYFVAFAPSLSFRDLKENSTMTQANREARERNVDSNPIFQDGDLIYDGVIIREIPEIPVQANAGNGGTVDVAPTFLCGAQAVALAWGQEPKSTKKAETDYGFATGIGIEECRGIEKIVFNQKDHGMVTGWFAAEPDA
jgi:N4-gp56 family major capsid protein